MCCDAVLVVGISHQRSQQWSHNLSEDVCDICEIAVVILFYYPSLSHSFTFRFGKCGKDG